MKFNEKQYHLRVSQFVNCAEGGCSRQWLLGCRPNRICFTARRMHRCWYLGVEENNVCTVKRVLNCDGIGHVDW